MPKPKLFRAVLSAVLIYFTTACAASKPPEPTATSSNAIAASNTAAPSDTAVASDTVVASNTPAASNTPVACATGSAASDTPAACSTEPPKPAANLNTAQSPSGEMNFEQIAAQTYKAGEFTITLGMDDQRGNVYRGCDIKGNCLELDGGTMWRDGGQRGFSWENKGYTYAISWTEGSSGPMYLNVLQDGSRLMRQEMVPIAQSSAATTTESDANILGYFYSNKDTLNLCNSSLNEDYFKTGSEVYQIDGQKYLVKVGCFLAAYQPSVEFWLYQKTNTASGVDVQPLNLVEYRQEEGQTTKNEVHNIGGLATYDEGQRRLTVFTKFRGIGDCGTFSEYQFDGNKFDLVSYRAKFDCDGNFMPPEQYPQVGP
ncbi:MAG TPA: DUF1176 domain-containing protein [Oscillatoriaceae cyanobacterium M33_DOE_052]|uniref:DUF1176 domain-containing protein n=1 Tax=Planktothricoides sp. SpSt-374 TaxID=2282167 RepID=A0A7C3ZNY5_9CYAN|nr:DUF1176 domain-containing protein [Oscillatoriaceae cyanobacterium M33_DOE_052]